MQALATKPYQTNAKSLIPWGPVAAIVVTVGAYFLSQILSAFILWIYPLSRGWDQQQANKWFSGSVYAQFLFVLVVEALTLWFLWLFLKKRGGHASQLGLKKPKMTDIGYGLAGFMTYFPLYILFLTILQRLIPSLKSGQKQELGFSTNTSGLPLVLVFISLVLLPVVVEEIITRGFLYSGLRSKLPKVIAAVITSILFALAHLQVGSGNSLLWVAAVDTFILSMVLVYLRDKTGSLWSPFIVHGLKNSVAFVSLFVLKLS
mgnify:CR=1 FL=1